MWQPNDCVSDLLRECDECELLEMERENFDQMKLQQISLRNSCNCSSCLCVCVCVCDGVEVRKWTSIVADPLELHNRSLRCARIVFRLYCEHTVCVTHTDMRRECMIFSMRLFYWSHLSFVRKCNVCISANARRIAMAHLVYFMLNRNSTQKKRRFHFVVSKYRFRRAFFRSMHVFRLFASRTSLKYRKRITTKKKNWYTSLYLFFVACVCRSVGSLERECLRFCFVHAENPCTVIEMSKHLPDYLGTFHPCRLHSLALLLCQLVHPQVQFLVHVR